MIRRALLFIMLALGWSGHAYAADPGEDAKIEYLLNQLEHADIVFIRNDVKMTPKQAADHVRDKWKMQYQAIRNANMFIARAGTKSIQSGKAYIILLPDGTLEPSAKWLTDKLKALEKTLTVPPDKQPETAAGVSDDNEIQGFTRGR